ncbi:unnamed protein product [Litomosoides sigmodontis]|uniref:Uncharacterized protein n=1 Tax=Litomosoides sigmodontis TaxID=42156 RepID=A0A3P6TRM5_LITSI|nr:unnamed protein product [Litomosoides sigmodontis]
MFVGYWNCKYLALSDFLLNIAWEKAVFHYLIEEYGQNLLLLHIGIDVIDIYPFLTRRMTRNEFSSAVSERDERKGQKKLELKIIQKENEEMLC